MKYPVQQMHTENELALWKRELFGGKYVYNFQFDTFHLQCGVAVTREFVENQLSHEELGTLALVAKKQGRPAIVKLAINARLKKKNLFHAQNYGVSPAKFADDSETYKAFFIDDPTVSVDWASSNVPQPDPMDLVIAQMKKSIAEKLDAMMSVPNSSKEYPYTYKPLTASDIVKAVTPASESAVRITHQHYNFLRSVIVSFMLKADITEIDLDETLSEQLASGKLHIQIQVTATAQPDGTIKHKLILR